MAKTTQIAARISLVLAALFLAILIALHFLRTDLDPSWRFISEYEIGDFGWMMRLAFAALAVSCASLCIAVFPYARTIAGWIGMFLAAICIPDKVNKLHELGAMLDNVPFAAPLVNWSLSCHPAWSSSKRLLALTAGLPLLGLVVFIGSLALMLPANGGQPGPSVLAGWPNRFFILAHLAWLMSIAWRCLALTKEGPRGPKIPVESDV